MKQLCSNKLLALQLLLLEFALPHFDNITFFGVCVMPDRQYLNKREIWVDYSKAIGIVLVVYGHVAHGIYKASLPINKDVYLLIDSVIYSFHMPLFFFLSGLYFYPF
jgi:hypothetical protein